MVQKAIVESLRFKLTLHFLVSTILEIIMVQRCRILEDEWNTTTTTGTREFQEIYGAKDSAKAMGYALKINLTLRTLQSLRHQY